MIIKENIAIGIGLHKSGTSWLNKQLELHPDVHLLQRDTHAFSKYAVKDKEFEEHISQFTSHNKSMSIEMSNSYLLDANSLIQIKQKLPKSKIFLILRDPIDRVISHYFQEKKIGGLTETDSFESFCLAPETKEIGNYKKHLKKLYNIFESDQIHLMLFDDIVHQPLELLNNFYEFLNIEKLIVYDKSLHQKVNAQRNSKWIWLEQTQNHLYYKLRENKYSKPVWLLAKKSGLGVIVKKLNSKKPETLDIQKQLKKELIEYYKKDVDYLRQHAQRPLLWNKNF